MEEAKCGFLPKAATSFHAIRNPQSAIDESCLPPGRAGCYFPAMRRLCFWLTMLCLLTLTARTYGAAEGKVIKALPEFLDSEGRSALSPSLYDRDAYQLYLRRHPAERTGLKLTVQWKAGGVDWSRTKLRAELRGVLGNNLHTTTLEIPVKKSSFFGNWTDFKIEGVDYPKFGELVAWHVTLWEGDKQLAELQSFLWTGVGK
jgi:hypothetical protein